MRKLLGKKIGMTQVFDENGRLIPVTILEAGVCVVLGQNKKNVIVGYDDTNEKKIKKPQAGFFKKIGITPKKVIREIPKEAGKEYKQGEEVTINMFRVGDFVDVQGIAIGKGFQGGVRRWGWSGGPDSHGSMSHKRPGSIGASSDPSRVLKGHHMPGHMGASKKTIQNLKIVKIDEKERLIAVKGAVPGNDNSVVTIGFSIKKKRAGTDTAKEETVPKDTKNSKKSN